jgi:hypothetical protein
MERSPRVLPARLDRERRDPREQPRQTRETRRVGVDTELGLTVAVDLVEALRGDVEQDRDRRLALPARNGDGDAKEIVADSAGFRLDGAQRNALRRRSKNPPSSSR